MSVNVSEALSLVDASAGTRGQRECETRLRSAVDAHYLFVWRALRRLGVPKDEADDVAQEVFLLFSRKLDGIEEGLERAFLFRSAAYLAMHAQRAFRRRRTMEESAAALETIRVHPSAEVDAERQEDLALLDTLLAELPEELRSTVVLCELEEMTMIEAAEILGLPQGTVASRLRRARAELSAAVQRMQRSRR